ncbi:MAG: 2-hydroxyacid dehydrogenase [Bacteroidales bacterium]|nr:2-hydroxyacid dehydrogenase [Bacteroidales bacterium]MBN2763092.1 2-hydroxyacid dehydrogenase [Bacteroidales bacterium]
MKTKIAFFDTKPYDKESFNEINKSYGFDIKYFRYHLTPDNIVLAQGFDVVIVFVNDIINDEMVHKLVDYGVKIIALRCSGFNNIDLKAALGKIKILRVPAYSPNAIAEHTVALMLSLNRKIHRAYFRTRDANFALQGLLGFNMHGKTAGVIGTGRIGKALIKILRGFEMKVIAYDKYIDHDFALENRIEYVGLDEVFSRSDIISLNCPLTKETEYLINRDSIALMKRGVMIINTGRGKLIKTADLINALKSGRVGSAGLDVYEEESKFFFEDLSDRVLTDDILARLLTFNNVIITSHQGFFTQEALYNIASTTMQNIQDFLDKKPLVNEVCYNCP